MKLGDQFTHDVGDITLTLTIQDDVNKSEHQNDDWVGMIKATDGTTYPEDYEVEELRGELIPIWEAQAKGSAGMIMDRWGELKSDIKRFGLDRVMEGKNYHEGSE